MSAGEAVLFILGVRGGLALAEDVSRFVIHWRNRHRSQDGERRP